MIKINLLPVEKRHAEHTPLPRLLLVLAGAGVTAGMVVAISWMHLRISHARENREARQAEVNGLNDVVTLHSKLTAIKQAHDTRKSTINQLKPPFRWTEALDAFCEALETKHKKIWVDEIRAFEASELRSKAQPLGFTPEAGLYASANNVSLDPDPLLKFRQDAVLRPAEKPAAEGAAKAKAPKVLIDHFNGGILKTVSFSLKDQPDLEDGASQTFQLEFYMKKAGEAAK